MRASKSGVWSKCPGSTRLKTFDPGASPEAAEGTLFHLVVQGLFQGVWPRNATPEEINMSEFMGRHNDTGVVVTEGMLETALRGAKFYDSIAGDDPMLEVEFSNGLPPGVTGTADFVTYDPDFSVVRVADLKYGFSPVEAVGNPQLMCYSAGAVEYYSRKKIVPKVVELYIFQPRDFIDGPVKMWSLDFHEWQRENEKIWSAADRALKDKTLSAGSHCKYCLSKVHCPAFLENATGALEGVSFNIEGLDLTPEQLAPLFQYIKRCEEVAVAARKSFEQFLTFKIESGVPIPGWTVGRAKGKRKWDASIEEIRAAGEFAGVNLLEEKPISITAAMKHKSLHGVLDSLIKKPEGAKKLLPFNEKSAKEVFND